MLVLTFLPQGKETMVELIQAGVPERLYSTLVEGWPHRYWQPWRAYLMSH